MDVAGDPAVGILAANASALSMESILLQINVKTNTCGTSGMPWNLMPPDVGRIY